MRDSRRLRRPRPGSRRTAPTRTALLAVASLAGLAVAPPAHAEPGPDAMAGDPATVASAEQLRPAAVPRLAWTPCGAPFECATATVPLDWSRPGGRTISLALAKLPATGNRIGTVFVNPGGPGASGVEAVLAVPEVVPAAVRARFDVVGFDPRFVAASRPAANCLDDDRYVALATSQPAFPVTAAEEASFTRAQAEFTAGCATTSALSYASTASVARDLDLLRQAVGDRALTYVGYSYGSYLGQVYAQLFPGRARAMVLDGVLDGQAWMGTAQSGQTTPFTARIGSAEASRESLDEFFRLCLASGPERCALAAQGDPAAGFAAIADSLLAEPVPLGDGTRLDYPTLISATTAVLYAPQSWRSFAAELQALSVELADSPVGASVGAASSRPAAAAALASSDADRGRTVGPRLLAAARSVAGRADQSGVRPGMPVLAMPALAGPGVAPAERPRSTPDTPGDQGPSADNPAAAFAAVTCTDTRNPTSAATWASAAADSDDRNRYVGRAWTWSGAACISWPLRDRNAYRGPIGARLSSPMLLIGNRYDPATSYQGAAATARRYPGSRLLTVRGYGHTSSAVPSRCVDAAVSAYLVDRKLPASGATCTQDVAPFAP